MIEVPSGTSILESEKYMGLFSGLFKKKDEIVAIADGKVVETVSVSDPVFAQEMMGKTLAFSYDTDKVVLHAPASGTLTVLFPTGHAFGITTDDGVELLVHCGVDTVSANGDGFKLFDKKQGDRVNAGDPIVEVDLKKLKETYDMSTMLVITNPNGKTFEFVGPCDVKLGQSVIK